MGTARRSVDAEDYRPRSSLCSLWFPSDSLWFPLRASALSASSAVSSLTWVRCGNISEEASMEASQPLPGEPADPPDPAQQPATCFEGADPLTEELRARLVASLRSNGSLNSPDVAEALLRVPRHLFLPQIP